MLSCILSTSLYLCFLEVTNLLLTLMQPRKNSCIPFCFQQ
uniref:Uncharacterized protein n=1 Tax=Arundo donax TaxID=35708 RepID=A0A0A9AJK1_ARUDO